MNFMHDLGVTPADCRRLRSVRENLIVLEDRYGNTSTIIASQLEPKDWHRSSTMSPSPMPAVTPLSTTRTNSSWSGSRSEKLKEDLTKGSKPAKQSYPAAQRSR